MIIDFASWSRLYGSRFRCVWLCIFLTLLVQMPMPVVAKVFDQSIAVRDYSGREVVLSAPAQRVVALAPHIVENLYSAGAGEKLVAAVAYSDYPSQAKRLPRVGGFQSLSIEKILAAKPDLVIVWRSGNGETIVRELERFAIPYYLDEPQTLDDVARSINDFSTLTGGVGPLPATQHYLLAMAHLREKHKYSEPLQVFFQVWDKPLMTIGGSHIISDMLEVCAGVNIYGDLKVLSPVISMESLLTRDPDVIVAGADRENQGGFIAKWQRWPSLTAIRNAHFYTIPNDIVARHTLRMLDGTQQLCQKLAQARVQRQVSR